MYNAATNYSGIKEKIDEVGERLQLIVTPYTTTTSVKDRISNYDFSSWAKIARNDGKLTVGGATVMFSDGKLGSDYVIHQSLASYPLTTEIPGLISDDITIKGMQTTISGKLDSSTYETDKSDTGVIGQRFVNLGSSVTALNTSIGLVGSSVSVLNTDLTGVRTKTDLIDVTSDTSTIKFGRTVKLGDKFIVGSVDMTADDISSAKAAGTTAAAAKTVTDALQAGTMAIKATKVSIGETDVDTDTISKVKTAAISLDIKHNDIY